MQIAQFAKAVFNMSAICKMKKCLFRSTPWRIVPLSICVICANFCKSCFKFAAICKTKKCIFRSTLWRIVFNLCNLWIAICKILQNEEMSFQIYSLEDRTLINLRNLCILHNLQKLFSIWVEFAKRRNVFSDLHVGGSYPYQFV